VVTRAVLDGSQQYQVKMSNTFEVLENLCNDDVHISRAWEILDRV
jgi:hypothetical protein